MAQETKEIPEITALVTHFSVDERFVQVAIGYGYEGMNFVKVEIERGRIAPFKWHPAKIHWEKGSASSPESLAQYAAVLQRATEDAAKLNLDPEAAFHEFDAQYNGNRRAGYPEGEDGGG